MSFGFNRSTEYLYSDGFDLPSEQVWAIAIGNNLGSSNRTDITGAEILVTAQQIELATFNYQFSPGSLSQFTATFNILAPGFNTGYAALVLAKPDLTEIFHVLNVKPYSKSHAGGVTRILRFNLAGVAQV